MARTVIARTALPATGFNLTDATYTTLGVGATNGVEAPYRAGDLLVLNNTTAGSVTYTIKVAQPGVYAGQGVVVPDISVVVGIAKIVAYPIADIMNQATGVIQVDCTAAAKALVLAMSA